MSKLLTRARAPGLEVCPRPPLHHPGFDSSVLSEFRARLIEGGLEMQLLDTLLEALQEKGLLKARGRARTDSTHVLAAVRSVGRLVNCIETVRSALNALAEAIPIGLAPLSTEWVSVTATALVTIAAKRQRGQESYGYHHWC